MGLCLGRPTKRRTLGPIPDVLCAPGMRCVIQAPLSSSGTFQPNRLSSNGDGPSKVNVRAELRGRVSIVVALIGDMRKTRHHPPPP